MLHGTPDPPLERPDGQPPPPRRVHALKERHLRLLEPGRLDVGVEGQRRPVVGRAGVPPDSLRADVAGGPSDVADAPSAPSRCGKRGQQVRRWLEAVADAPSAPARAKSPPSVPAGTRGSQRPGSRRTRSGARAQSRGGAGSIARSVQRSMPNPIIFAAVTLM